MTALKKQIKQQELAIMARKNSLQAQIEQLNSQVQKSVASPLGLISAFFVGVLFVYLIRPKKPMKKGKSDYLSVLNRMVAHISLLLSIRRLFYKM